MGAVGVTESLSELKKSGLLRLMDMLPFSIQHRTKLWLLLQGRIEVLRRRQRRDSGHAAFRTWRWVAGHVVYLMNMKGLQR
jgi:hypothetical protein